MNDFSDSTTTAASLGGDTDWGVRNTVKGVCLTVARASNMMPLNTYFFLGAHDACVDVDSKHPSYVVVAVGAPF